MVGASPEGFDAQAEPHPGGGQGGGPPGGPGSPSRPTEAVPSPPPSRTVPGPPPPPPVPGPRRPRLDVARRRIEHVLGGPARSRVILLCAAVLALSSADASTVGAAATELRDALHITNADIGLLVGVSSAVGAIGGLPFGILVDRVNRIRLLTATICLWGAAMLVSATAQTFAFLLLTRVALGFVTAVASPAVASLVGDYFTSEERGRVYGYILTGELLGSGVGFFITGDVAAISWRAAFVILAAPAFALAWQVRRLPEPQRGGATPIATGATSFDDLSPSVHAAAPESATDPVITDTQRQAIDQGIEPDRDHVLRADPRRLDLLAATRYVLGVRTNVVLIVSSASGYFFMTGVQTFGLEFVNRQYGVSTLLANALMMVVGVGAIAGVAAGGNAGDALVRRGQINGRMLVAGITATATAAFFVPAAFTTSPVTALPYITAAAFCLTAQNPTLDAARLDIMPPGLWGRAEGIRTLLRSAAQSVAPLVFGGLSDLLGGGHSGLRDTFVIMLLPLAASGVILLRGMRFYPTDVATAAASVAAGSGGRRP